MINYHLSWRQYVLINNVLINYYLLEQLRTVFIKPVITHGWVNIVVVRLFSIGSGLKAK